MVWCLSPPLEDDDTLRQMTMIHRFDPRFWTVDFPRPMLAAVEAIAPDALRVSLAFTGQDTLAGLIWESRDRWDHPSLAYLERRDYRHTQLRFRWRGQGVRRLDAVHGPTLTLEGRDAAGQPRAWYVRLWNYAEGTPDDAVIALDFDALAGGFLHPEERDPVWAGDLDRIFLSMMPPAYDGSATPFAAMEDGQVTLEDIHVTGSGAVLPLGDAMLPAHQLSIATAYDDAYHLTPQRVMRQVEALGYRGPLLHYVGMSHFMPLVRRGDAWRIDETQPPMAAPAATWHRALAREVLQWGGGMVWSLSYEVFAAYCPPDWMQRASDGGPALTGWSPPSTLLSPVHAKAMRWLQAMAAACMQLAREVGLAPQFQVGEPWWWVTPARQICLYDTAAVAALGGNAAPINDMAAPLSDAQRTLLDRAGEALAASTLALAAAAQAAVAPLPVTRYLLIYLPTILDPAMPDLRRANLPKAWASPAFDILQIEAYDWVTRGQKGLAAAARRAVTQSLRYPSERTQYLAGFVVQPADYADWAEIVAAAADSQAAGDARSYIWALPQVARDGFTFVDDAAGGDEVQSFDDVDFPLALGHTADVVASFSTAIFTGQSGAEQRVPEWEHARARYDAGPGIRSEDDVRSLLTFFRARRGPAIGFRFRDPFDHASRDSGAITARDQWIGAGDGVITEFALIKHYGNGAGAVRRRITRPVVSSVLVSVDGVAATAGWSLAAGGILRFAAPPAKGAVIRAGYLFDVPVRFAEDQLQVSRATYLAGEVASVPLIELREL